MIFRRVTPEIENAFRAALFARHDSNSRPWYVQTIGEQSTQRVVGAIF